MRGADQAFACFPIRTSATTTQALILLGIGGGAMFGLYPRSVTCDFLDRLCL